MQGVVTGDNIQEERQRVGGPLVRERLVKEEQCA